MKRKTRKRVFYALVALFCVLSVFVVLYAEGWRLDLGTFHINKVGAIYIHSYPRDAAITIDKKSVQNESGILSSGTTVTDLFPKNYVVTLAYKGYDSWQEDVSVSPSVVTELKYAVLVPASSTVAASGTIADFTLQDEELVTQSASGTIMSGGQTAGRGTIISVGPDTANVIFQSPSTGNYTLYTFATGASTNLSTALSKAGVSVKSITSLAIDPYNAQGVILRESDRMWIYNLTTAVLTPLDQVTGQGSALGPSIAVSPTVIAWTRFATASNTSELFLYDKPSGTLVTSSVPIAAGNAELKWVRTGLLGVLQNDGSLYVYDTGAGTLRKVADSVQDFEPTDDGSMIATIERSSMEIFSLNDPSIYYRFNVPSIASARALIWYHDMTHLFIVYPDHVAFLDFADSGLSNLTTVADGTSPAYDPQTNALYIIDPTGNLQRFDFPS